MTKGRQGGFWDGCTPHVEYFSFANMKNDPGATNLLTTDPPQVGERLEKILCREAVKLLGGVGQSKLGLGVFSIVGAGVQWLPPPAVFLEK